MSKLTEKEEAYCLARANGSEPLQALQIAYEYAPTVKRATLYNDAYKMERKPQIVAKMAELTAAAVTEAVMSRREALERLSRIARAGVGRVATLERDERTRAVSLRIRDEADIAPEDLDCVAVLKENRHGITAQMHSPLVAIKQLAEMLGWDVPSKVEVTGKDGGPVEATVDLSGLSAEALLELWNAASNNEN